MNAFERRISHLLGNHIAAVTGETIDAGPDNERRAQLLGQANSTKISLS